jgi:hypothetical protein
MFGHIIFLFSFLYAHVSIHNSTYGTHVSIHNSMYGMEYILVVTVIEKFIISCTHSQDLMADTMLINSSCALYNLEIKILFIYNIVINYESLESEIVGEIFGSQNA